MKLLNIFVCIVCVTQFAGCSTSGASKKEDGTTESRIFDYKAPPKAAPKLEVPPELTTYTGDDRYSIPGEGESGTRYSEYQQNGMNRRASGVLPPARNVHLEKAGTQRWLVVNDKAENVWPVIKAFWEENGLSIAVDNPQAGIMETDWQENMAKIPQDSLQAYMGKYIEGFLSAGERDQYHTRIERSKDGNSTEIYITHYGLQEVRDEDESGFRWISRPSDPELEATMLQLLMNKLSGGSGVISKYQKVGAKTENSAGNVPKLKKLEDGSQIIQLSEAFDKSWRKVGLALDQSGMVLADKDRSKGIYYLSAGKDEPKAKQGSEKLPRAQVMVKEVADGCEVSVNNVAGSSNADTRKLVDTLFKALGKI